MITHALRFEDEAAAVAALPQHRIDGEAGPCWDTFVDGPFAVMRGTGVMVADPETGEDREVMEPVAGYHLNVNLEDLDDTLPGLIGAWDHPGHLVFGDAPVAPMRVFS